MTTRLQVKESEMMQRLRDAEHSQLVAEMRQRIAELEIKVISFQILFSLRSSTFFKYT